MPNNISAKEKAALVALRSVYWLVKENIPLSKFQSFITFQKGMGVEDLEFGPFDFV